MTLPSVEEVDQMTFEAQMQQMRQPNMYSDNHEEVNL